MKTDYQAMKDGEFVGQAKKQDTRELFLYSGHEFTYNRNELTWVLRGEQTSRPEDFLKFMDPINTIFSVNGRLFVVMEDGRINEIVGFNGKNTDYERLYVSMRLWL